MAWNKKKILAKMGSYFESKSIPYEIKDNSMIEAELYFKESGFVLYPYITLDEMICSININVSRPAKNFNYEILNRWNQKSKFFKAFLLENVIVLEYRFVLNEFDVNLFDAWIDSIYMLENDIDAL